MKFVGEDHYTLKFLTLVSIDLHAILSS